MRRISSLSLSFPSLVVFLLLSSYVTVKRSGRVGKNVIFPIASRPSGWPNGRYNVMKRGLVVRARRTSKLTPDLLTIISIFYTHRMVFTGVSRTQGKRWERSGDGTSLSLSVKPTASGAIHLRIVATCVSSRNFTVSSCTSRLSILRLRCRAYSPIAPGRVEGRRNRSGRFRWRSHGFPI